MSSEASFAPVLTTSFFHFAASSWMKRPNSAGDMPPGSDPSVASFSATSDCLSALLISALSLAVISAGMPAGPTMPPQP